MTTQHHPIVIAGGGTAGITVAALLRSRGVDGIAIIEPSDKHYYQPLWTLVGGGVLAKEATERAEADYIPDGVSWIRDAVAAFEPDAGAVVTRDGTRITYDQLVVAVGIQLDWHKIAGLEGALGKDGIVSNYRYDVVDSTWRALSSFDGGTACSRFRRHRSSARGLPRRSCTSLTIICAAVVCVTIADRVRIGRSQDLRALREDAAQGDRAQGDRDAVPPRPRRGAFGVARSRVPALRPGPRSDRLVRVAPRRATAVGAGRRQARRM